MGFLDAIFKRNSELGFMFDLEAYQDTANRMYMKRIAIDTCVSFLGRTISQSEFRVKEGKEFVKNELYYRLNVRPNKNMTASTFWQTFVDKLIHDNECLIIQADDGDLLIADSFEHNVYAVLEDNFSKVVVKNYEFKRSFKQGDVIHIRYTNEKLTTLIDGLFKDYGELFGRILNSQKRKNQVRATVDMDAQTAKNKEGLERLQTFIDKMYKSTEERDIVITPQTPGFKYEEHFSGGGTGIQSVDEVSKVADGFLNQVAMLFGIPISLLHGDMADVEKQTKNYMMFTVEPLLKKIKDEADATFFTKEEWLKGNSVETKSVSYNSLFDLATSIDKLIASGTFTGNEIRLETGYEKSDDPALDKHVMTKNYQETGTDSSKGGEK